MENKAKISWPASFVIYIGYKKSTVPLPAHHYKRVKLWVGIRVPQIRYDQNISNKSTFQNIEFQFDLVF